MFLQSSILDNKESGVLNMKTNLECLPCFLRQSLDAARLSEACFQIQKDIINEVNKKIFCLSLDSTPPEIAGEVYAIIAKHINDGDVYSRIKSDSNKKALNLYPKLKDLIKDSEDPLLMAGRIAVAGNVIDYGLPHVFDIENEIEECLNKDFAIFDWECFREKISKARTVLYILDNAGEVVFDRLLIEQIDAEVICAVREKPVINDATVADAREAGLDKVAEVISSGSDCPGTVISRVNNCFRRIYFNSDVVISKGQGNFETLSEEKRDIFFMFKAKCSVVARHIGCKVGDSILTYSSGDKKHLT